MRCAWIGRGSGFVAMGGFCFLPLEGEGSSLSGVGDCDSCCGHCCYGALPIVGLCLLPVSAPKALSLCCERLPLGSFFAVTFYGFTVFLFCAILRLDVCLSPIAGLLPAPGFPVFGAVAVVGDADFCAAFWAMPHPESLPDFYQIALRSHSFFQCEFSVLLRCLPTSCVAAMPGPIKISKIFLPCRQEYLADFSWCLPHCHITAGNCM